MFHAPTLVHHLLGLRFGHPIYLFQQIGSTNEEARRLAEGGGQEGLIVVAEEQTAGRGRAGRKWITPAGSAIAFSLILRPPLPPARSARLTMLAGVAACEAIEQTTGLRAELKWPNDVLIAGKKVAGILSESAVLGDQLEYAVLGLGLNVSFAPLAAEVDFPATSLQAEAGREVDRLKLLRAILTGLEAHYPFLMDERLYQNWRARLAMMGRPALAHTESGAHRGRAEGVDADGALIFRLDSGEALRLTAGDVRLRPI
ncbi:MAG: Biotin--[acetyl-CoA-carboxylase] ligase [Anaerolineales bacterium]|jgi:BirA family biotin operon repressor/biotin-[acetyl-CoA-carboxylase] ligase|nr:Biotin--[acetyl-CoA-carboxylase] ligase [Anaerolineales bacterium]